MPVLTDTSDSPESKSDADNPPTITTKIATKIIKIESNLFLLNIRSPPKYP